MNAPAIRAIITSRRCFPKRAARTRRTEPTAICSFDEEASSQSMLIIFYQLNGGGTRHSAITGSMFEMQGRKKISIDIKRSRRTCAGYFAYLF